MAKPRLRSTRRDMQGTWERNCIKYRNEPGIMPYLWCSQEKWKNEELVCLLCGETTPIGVDFSLQSVPIRKLVSHQNIVYKEMVERYMEVKVEFPPITVIKHLGKYYIIEGNHRVNALIRMGRPNVGARVYRYRDVKRAYKALQKTREKSGKRKNKRRTESEQKVGEEGRN